VTTPDTPEQPDAKTEQDAEAERKSVATDEAPAQQETAAAEKADGPANIPASSNGTVSLDQETTKFRVEDVSGETATSSAPPPWQRVTADSAAAAAAAATTISSDAYSGQQHEPFVDTSSQQTTNFRPVTPETSGSPLDSPTIAARTSVNIGGATATVPRGSAAPTALRRPGRGPRRASLQIKRVDPWSVLKLALVLGFAMFLVWMVAVGVLYSVLGGMGVWAKLNGTYNDLVQGGDTSSGDLISAGRVFGIAAVIGLVNVILFTAMATVSAFIYNVSADLAGGIEVTLSERE
jgi:Transmembrane domain of unknown function (DUF3566)